MEEIENFNEEAFYRKLGLNVKKIRKKGLSQLDLSLAMGLKSVSLIGQAEIYYDKSHFNLVHLSKIPLVLKVDIKDFFD